MKRSLLWRPNERDGVSNHQPLDCFLNRLFRRRSRKHQSSASMAFVRGIHRRLVNSPYKEPITRKMFPFDDVIMYSKYHKIYTHLCFVFVVVTLSVRSRFVYTCLYEFISPRFASVELDRCHNASEITQTRVKLANNKSHQNTRNLVLEKHKKRYENICWRCHSFSICIERLHSQNKSICVCGEKFYLRKFSTESKFIWRKLRHESRTLYLT